MFKRLYYIILQRLYVLKNKNKPCQGKVYMFHNVNDEQDTYAINKENFKAFVEYLKKNKKVVDIETLIKEKDQITWSSLLMMFSKVCIRMLIRY